MKKSDKKELDVPKLRKKAFSSFKNTDLYKEIMEKIDSAADNGQLSVWVETNDDDRIETAKEFLKEEGFDVTVEGAPANNHALKIYWC